MTEIRRKTEIAGGLRLGQVSGDARHSFLFFMDSMLNIVGLSKEVRIERLREINSIWCSPPIPDTALHCIQEETAISVEMALTPSL